MAIIFDEKGKIFFLITENSEYQMKVDEYGMLLHSYYGASVGRTDMSYLIRNVDRGFSGNSYECREKREISSDTLPLEYGCFGAGDYRVSALETVLANGSRTADIRYKSHSIRHGRQELAGLPYVRDMGDEADSLEIILADEAAGLEVRLIYNVFAEKDVITRSAKICNISQGEIRLMKAASACIDMQHKDMDLIHFYGRHAMERLPERLRIMHGIHKVSSKRGMSSHHENPFAILCGHDANERSGECYGFMLMYSGNHAEEIEADQTGSIRVVTGIGSEGFEWRLGSGESFETPEAIMAFTDKGLNELSFLYHRIIRENVCPARFRDMKRPVLINNWEGTYFDFDEDSIRCIADAAHEAGCEMIVLDDGWFGVRNDDNTGLGDWFVNKDKLPGGLSAITDHVTSLGMRFGLWFEPEMISEDSKLYREHPDWALSDPDRKPVMARNQLVLDMSRGDVVDYLYDSISGILDSADISYIKWDFNRSLANVYSNAASSEAQGEIAHRFVLGTYELLSRLSKAYPDVMIEGCSGGGGRFDAGMLFYCPQIWCSDNTDAINRLKIQRGTSYGYPVCTMGSHVSASPNHQTGRETPLLTRAIVAMHGSFGYELDPRQLTAEEREEIRAQIGTFNKYYELIHIGKYYRLTDETDGDYYVAWESVAEDGSEALLSLVVTDTRANPEIPFVRLCGLDGEGKYVADGILSSAVEIPADKDEDTVSCESERIYSGYALMNGGYAFNPLYGVYPAVQVHFKRI